MVSINPADSGFSKLDENPICFAFGVALFGLYISLFVWARKKDKEDVLKVRVFRTQLGEIHRTYFAASACRTLLPRMRTKTRVVEIEVRHEG